MFIFVQAFSSQYLIAVFRWRRACSPRLLAKFWVPSTKHCCSRTLSQRPWESQLVPWSTAELATLYSLAQRPSGHFISWFLWNFDRNNSGFSVAVCKGDPAIPEFHEKRALRGLDRISSHLDSRGQRKRARSQKENQTLEKKTSKIEMGYQRAGALVKVIDGDENQPPKPKKRRLNADQRLALGPINWLIISYLILYYYIWLNPRFLYCLEELLNHNKTQIIYIFSVIVRCRILRFRHFGPHLPKEFFGGELGKGRWLQNHEAFTMTCLF